MAIPSHIKRGQVKNRCCWMFRIFGMHNRKYIFSQLKNNRHIFTLFLNHVAIHSLSLLLYAIYWSKQDWCALWAHLGFSDSLEHWFDPQTTTRCSVARKANEPLLAMQYSSCIINTNQQGVPMDKMQSYKRCRPACNLRKLKNKLDHLKNLGMT